MRKSLVRVLFPSKELQTLNRGFVAGVKELGRDVQHADCGRNILHMLGSAARLKTLKRHLEMKYATTHIACAASPTKTSWGFFLLLIFQRVLASHYFPICIGRESDPCAKDQSVPSQKGLLAHRLVENWESALLNISEQLSFSLLWPQFSSLLFSEVIQLGFVEEVGFLFVWGCFWFVFFELQFKTHDSEFVWEGSLGSCLQIGITNLQGQ